MTLGKKYLWLLPVFLAVVLLFQGCMESEQKGAFDMTIGGDLDYVISGNAVFGGATDPDSRKPGFALILTTGKTNPGNRLDGEALYLATLQPGRPAAGSYTVTNPDDTSNVDSGFWGYARLDQARVVTFVTQTGGITINTSTDDELSGSFQMRAVGYDFSKDPAVRHEITLSGEFTAEGGYAYIPQL